MGEAKKKVHGKKKRKAGITSKAKKKTAVARAVIRKGHGIVRINSRRLELVEPSYMQEFIREPLAIAGDAANSVDISISVSGGGAMGQAATSRAAIAKALVNYTNDEKLKQRFLAYDRMLLVDDVRKTEPKKPLGPKARRKKQKSKR